jgi:flagellar basal body-associated protein FliL
MKKTTQEDSPLLIWFMIIIFILIGGFVLYSNFLSWSEANKSQKSWSQTKGRVIQSSVSTQDAVTIKQTDTYIPYVEYSYEVQSKRYINSKIHFYNPKINSKERAEDIIKEYPKNKIINVYYDSKNPYKSALIIDSMEYSNAFLEILFGAFFLLLGSLFAYLKIKEELINDR